MREPGVGADQEPRRGHAVRQRGQAEASRAVVDGRAVRRRRAHAAAQVAFLRRPRERHVVAALRQGVDHPGPPLGRPAPGRCGGAGVDHDVVGAAARRVRRAEPQVLRAAVAARAAHEPAPPQHLVLALVPARTGVARSRVAEREQRVRPGLEQEAVALRPPPVQVDGEAAGGVLRPARPGPRPRQPGQPARRQDGVHHAEADEPPADRFGRRQHDAVARPRAAEPAQGGHAGQRVAQPQRAKSEHGHEDLRPVRATTPHPTP
ncbi:hypothetical protein GCM10010102_30000 [Promicromonospora citrea]|uniref:Uncharacterized protein n=1 Tax=Promicromonospora citrea TaxID=43677 RepID=A0A8H9GMS2_9MICO|nr:hypothetical protein GCM10010102_30000 [Promicromonospora citrea]